MSSLSPDTHDFPFSVPITVVDSGAQNDSRLTAPQVLSRSLRVLHLINGEHYSGAERVQDLLAMRLPESNASIEFACLKKGKFSRDRQCQSTPLHHVPMSSRWDLSVVGRVIRLARRRGVDLIHAHTPRAAMISGLAAPFVRCPWVFHVHSPTALDSTRALQNRINAWVEKKAVRRATAVIGVSGSMCSHMLEQGVPDHKVNRVPNGVTCQQPLAPKQPRGKRTITLGTVALFRPRKGTETLIDAVHRLRRAGHDVHLKAVGGFETPAYEEQLATQVQALGLNGRVQWTGYTQNVAAEMADFDIFVLPSHFGEGMPMVVLEAMALALPVVATRVEGVPEVIEHQISGRLAEPGNADSLVDEILELVKNPTLRLKIAQAGYHRQQQQFSDHSMARGVAEVYEQLIQLGHIRSRKFS